MFDLRVFGGALVVLLEFLAAITAVAIVGYLCFLATVFYGFVQNIVRNYRTDRLARAIRSHIYGRGIGHIHWNERADVMAVVTGKSLASALDSYSSQVRVGKKNPWDKVVVEVFPTYTFANSTESLRPVHTGTKYDLQNLLISLIRHLEPVLVTHLSKEEILRVAQEDLFTRDSQIYVPYAGSLSEKEGQRQFKAYGQRGLGEASKVLWSLTKT